MIRQEIIRRSPVRILEKSTHGGVGIGNIGIFAAVKGIGKTACLVHIATDRLLEGKHVIHVSFQDSPDHIKAWYEDTFNAIARQYKLDSATEIHDEIVRNRIVMNFRQEGLHITGIENAISALIEQGGFSADTLIIDGYDFSLSSTNELAEFRLFAKKLGLELWFSAPVDDTTGFDGASVPVHLKSFINEIAIIVSLQPREGYIHLSLVKDHDINSLSDPHLKLDPHILLIAEEE